MTLEELAKILKGCTDPKKLYGDGDKDKFLRQVAIVCHPDKYPGQPKKVALADKLRSQVFALFAEPAPIVTIIKSPKREYTLGRQIGVGDVADVYAAVGDSKEYIAKISRVVGGDKFLEVEEKTLAKIIKDAGSTNYDRFFPIPFESFPVRDSMQKRVNIFHFEPGFYTLEQVHQQHPFLDPKHLAWIYKGLLTGLGFAHLCGFVHGSVVPSHVHIQAEKLQLLGWGQSVTIKSKITSGSAKYISWYPHEVKNKQPASTSTDIYMAAKCIIYLSGGDVETNKIPNAVPPEMQRFLRSCLLEGSKMRPEDAWGLLKEFDEVLRGIYGPPKYQNLVMV